LSRFFVHGHSIGTFDPPPAPQNSECPFTLDLRMA